MPYFVFQINNHREYLCLGSFETYREARNDVRGRRSESESSGVVEFRMIFAGTEPEGEALLKTRREKIPSEDD